MARQIMISRIVVYTGGQIAYFEAAASS